MRNNVYLGHKAIKHLGQNFLHDPNIINAIVSSIDPKSSENLVEIGPGLGAITEALVQKIDKFTVIELDHNLTKRLRNHPILKDKLTIYEENAMQFNFTKLMRVNNKLRIFGNLPYNISTPLIFHLFKFHKNIQDMHFTLQKELVNRLAAQPGNKAYSRLTVMTQYYCKIVPVLEIPSTAFFPKPKINSAFVRLILHDNLPYPATSLKWLNRVCRYAFNQRRKTIRNCYKELLDIKILQKLGINPNIRPENLTLKEFVEIANWLDMDR
ncbi:ribosomal RNA small subunit methyltransferase A [Candidatus Photodesmus blepharus]|uniref:Ribosomal RNA small subunit methyltransferase A n=1 Tax=Candidatus Photodesmus blepharonis TaxID=1179155 RepID=A0A084CM16_9GAMM|nr:16S rRNA (adenine(1518)-N(6)/adenine(1519)-N(6))-dimethyltransferase RsmA [Candidatus Photodesmus blepharus]KEY90845.1 ribosomal RNA small subunit methyltransferase A [Candidatus Photodesmus blepharus]